MPSDAIDLCWVDGELVFDGRAVVRADDSAYREGRGCLTTLRIAAGRARFEDRHVSRLQDGAKSLRLGALADSTIRRAVAELAEAAFPDGEGVIRLQVSRDGAGATHLIGTARRLLDDPAEWSAILSAHPHGGTSSFEGAKVSSRLALALAADDARVAGVEEALLLDANERLVEGANSNLFVAARNGALGTPPLASGAVAGIARSLLLERLPEIEEREISKAELLGARELIAANAVRGARPITRLNGQPVGDGRPGPWSARLAEVLAGCG